MARTGASAVAVGILLSVLALIPPGCAAQELFTITMPMPFEVESGSAVAINLTVTNEMGPTYKTVVVEVFIYPSSGTPGSPQQDRTISDFAKGNRSVLGYSFTPKSEGPHSISVRLYNGSKSVYLWDKTYPDVFTATAAPSSGANGLPVAVLAAAAIAVAAAIGVVAFLALRRKRAAPKETVARPVYQQPAAEEKVQGKLPKDYYKFRREKFSRLKPVGLTRSGQTILGNLRNGEEVETQTEDQACASCCPKCGTEMGADWKTCKNCGARGTIERARESVKRLESTGADITNLRDMLASAEAAREAKNYDEAETYGHDVLERAKTQLRRKEEAQKPAEGMPAPPYGADEAATREAPAVKAAPAEGEPQGARGYEENEVAAKGCKEPPVAKEHTAAGGPVPAEEKKKEPNPCWNCGQGLRPEWKKCPFCNSNQEGICPSCGKTVKLRWNNCPQCRTNLKVEKPKPACPACGAEMPETGGCQSCKARSLIESVTRLVREVKAKGADVVEAEALMGRGELALKIKNYDKAVSHFQRAEELAKQARKDYRTRKLREKIQHAEKLIIDSAGEGADIAPATDMVAKAKQALSEERPEDGIALADKAAALAEESLENAMAKRDAGAKEKPPIPISVPKPTVLGTVKVKPRCPHCQEQVEENWPVCPFCQSDLSNRCANCGAGLKPGWKMCPVCEAPLK